MIRNEKQYEYTQELAKRCEYTLAQYDARDEEVKQNDPWWAAMRESVQSHLDAFNAEMAEYERLMKCDRAFALKIEAGSILEFPRVLIKARIAANVTQKELAERLGLEESRIKEYEDSDYQCASWGEIIDITEALAVELKTASFVVDFQEMEVRKKSLAEFVERKRKKLEVKAQKVKR
ncbi:MAG: helix-turn-helix transcriptional regulator [Oscillatoriaceae cyanobacterium Prado104]|jgi:transcriptional regulator with XRE-family HTH domain|nr:helix-turn-helix transcriptional regulator [Oscillatoriaceae cyanobacterium Prado104]